MNRIFFILPHNILSFNKNCFIHDYLLEPDRIIIKRKNLHFFFFFNRNNDLLTLNCRSCDDIYDSSVFVTTNGTGRTKQYALDLSSFVAID